MKSIPLELIVVGGGRVLNALIALGGLYAVTRLLPPDSYALVVLLNTFPAFAGLLLLNPVGQWLNRHLHEWHDNGTLTYRLDQMLVYILVVGAIVSGVGSLWFHFLKLGDVPSSLGVGVAIAGVTIFLTATIAWANVLNSLGRRIGGVLWQLISSGLGLLLAVWITSLYPGNAIAWIMGQGLGAALAFFGVREAVKRATSLDSIFQREKKSWLLDAGFLSYAFPLAGVTGLMWLEGNGYRLILDRVWEAKELGLFFLAISIPAQLTAVLESIVRQFAYPYFFRALAGDTGCDHQAEVTSIMVNTLTPLYSLWGAFLLVAAPQVLFLFGGDSFHGAVDWIHYGVLLEVARLTGSSWLLGSQAVKNYKPMVLPFALGGVGALFASFLALHAELSLGFFAFMLVMVAFLKNSSVIGRMRRILPIRVSWARLIGGGIILIIGLALSSRLSVNMGAFFSLSILLGSALVVSLIAYLHIRTAKTFHALLDQRLC